MRKTLFTLGFAVCLLAIFYPLISNWLHHRTQDKIITEYTETVRQTDTEELEREWEACLQYNQSIVQTSTVVTETESGRLPYGEDYRVDSAEYEARLNLEGNGVMGYVIIPKIDVYLPIRHYATEKVLESGVGHLPESSLPVGGASSHSVLTGHTGSTDKVIFTDLEQLEIGDHFFLSVLGELLVYQVDQVIIVLPYEVEELMITEGKDFCTLVTCTPYGINSHRLLVRGCRVELTPEMETELASGEAQEGIVQELAGEERSTENSRFQTYYLKAVFLGCILAGIILLSYGIVGNIRRKRT